MEVGKQKHQRFLKGNFYGYFYCCHKFGHKDANYGTKGKEKSFRRKKDTNTKDDGIQVRRIHHGNMWKKKSDYQDSKETQISNIGEVSKDDNEHNSAINKNDIHYEEIMMEMLGDNSSGWGTV